MLCLSNSKMTKEERRKLETIFKEVDANGDGKLSRDELINGFIKLGKTEEESKKEVSELLESLSTSPDSAIEYSRKNKIDLYSK